MQAQAGNATEWLANAEKQLAAASERYRQADYDGAQKAVLQALRGERDDLAKLVAWLRSCVAAM